MSDIFKGMAAGLIATGILTGLLVAQRALGVMPQVDLISLLSAVLGVSADAAVGWVVHLGLGAVAGGVLFAWLEPRLGADTVVKRGVLFGVLSWLAMMVVFMPTARAGLFGLRLGALAPIVLLLVNVLYGAVLGWAYGRMHPTATLAAHDSHHRAA
jgi:hypothetical protein